MNYFEFCRLIGTEKMSPEAEKLYIEAEENGEFNRKINTSLISKYFPNMKDVMTEKRIEKRYLEGKPIYAYAGIHWLAV